MKNFCLSPRYVKYYGSRTIALAHSRLSNRLSLRTVQINWTRKLVNYIGVYGLNKGIEKIIDDSKDIVSKSNLVDIIAHELNQSLKLISEETLKNPNKAKKLIKNKARDFIKLANLSQKGDEDFVRFVIDILLHADAIHFSDNSVHSGVVTFYAAAIAKEMVFPPRFITWMKTAGVLHDFGKTGVASKLLTETEIEEEQMRMIDEHLLIGVYLFQEIKWLKNVVKIIRHHHPHELFNGMLSPEGLGEELYILVQILKVADTYDGLTSKRKYKGEAPLSRLFDKREIKVFSREEALEKLRKWTFDQEVINALEKVTEKGEEYIFNIKNLFLETEVKFIWPGIEHLIKKNILPPTDNRESIRGWDNWLIERVPFLWLISEKRDVFLSNLDFANFLKGEVYSAAQEKNLKARLDMLVLEIQKKSEDFLGAVFEVLFRALNVGIRVQEDTFKDLVEFLYCHCKNMENLEKAIDVLCLYPKMDEDAFFDWLASKLYGEDTKSLPVYGERAFINNLHILLRELNSMNI